MTDYTDLDTVSIELARIANDEEKLAVLAKMTNYYPDELKKNLLYLRHLVNTDVIPGKDIWEH